MSIYVSPNLNGGPLYVINGGNLRRGAEPHYLPVENLSSNLISQKSSFFETERSEVILRMNESFEFSEYLKKYVLEKREASNVLQNEKKSFSLIGKLNEYGESLSKLELGLLNGILSFGVSVGIRGSLDFISTIGNGWSSYLFQPEKIEAWLNADLLVNFGVNLGLFFGAIVFFAGASVNNHSGILKKFNAKNVQKDKNGFLSLSYLKDISERYQEIPQENLETESWKTVSFYNGFLGFMRKAIFTYDHKIPGLSRLNEGLNTKNKFLASFVPKTWGDALSITSDFVFNTILTSGAVLAFDYVGGDPFSLDSVQAAIIGSLYLTSFQIVAHNILNRIEGANDSIVKSYRTFIGILKDGAAAGIIASQGINGDVDWVAKTLVGFGIVYFAQKVSEKGNK